MDDTWSGRGRRSGNWRGSQNVAQRSSRSGTRALNSNGYRSRNVAFDLSNEQTHPAIEVLHQNTPDMGPNPEYLHEERGWPRSQLEDRVVEIRYLEESLRGLEEDRKRDSEDMYRLEQNLTRYGAELASKRLQLGECNLAEQLCHELSKWKAEQKDKCKQKGHSVRMFHELEKEELLFMVERGSALIQCHDYLAAESVYDCALQRLQRLPKDANVSLHLILNAERGLCNALLQQDQKEKLKRARGIHYKAGNLKDSDAEDYEKHSWTILSAFYCEFITIKLRDHDFGIKPLKNIWKIRHEASNSYTREIESRTFELLRLFIERNEDHLAIRLIGAMCKDNQPLPDECSRAVIALVSHLHRTDQNIRALELLLITPGNSSPMEPGDYRMNVGWELAWSFCQSRDFSSAERALHDLLAFADNQSEPNESQIKALLAHAQLYQHKYELAKDNARAVLDDHGVACTLEHQGYHHADTLILAIIEDDKDKDRWTNAYKIWGQVFENAQSLKMNETNREQQQHHAAAGHIFAEKWDSWKETNGNARRNIKDKTNRKPDRVASKGQWSRRRSSARSSSSAKSSSSTKSSSSARSPDRASLIRDQANTLQQPSRRLS
ncbi:MAG: hypothetical protein Q9160_008319 [Pyrenula sp. 1 TL-2023]